MSDLIDPFIRGFGYSPVDLPLADVEWMTNRRIEAKNSYERLGLPTPRMEAWKFTNLKDVRKVDFHLATPEFSLAPANLPASIPALDAYKLVFVNGIFDADLSDLTGLPDGVELGSLAKAIEQKPEAFAGKLNKHLDADQDAIVALNTAYLADGLYLNVPRAVSLEKPVHLISVTYQGEDAVCFHPRHLIHIGQGARATLVETHVGIATEQAGLSNSVCEIELEQDSYLGHYKLQKDHDRMTALSISHVKADKNSVYDNFALQLGAKLVRNDIRVDVDGSHSEIRLNGAYHADKNRHHDTTTYVSHNVGDASCSEVYKGVLDDTGRAVFQAKIYVAKGADGTDGQQLHKALLLSDRAEVDAKPELEIYADDVKCAHGSTCGALDEHQLFYLRSRGIADEEARALLVQAYLHDAIDEIQNASIAEIFHEELSKKLTTQKAGD
ncbi:MAG: Fe-S cluster assembly protein SufD [Alphaproteobacteria bacterium]|nr:Fe-S cluster assembly protein SufD [Alphaproteobacteria bacterium]